MLNLSLDGVRSLGILLFGRTAKVASELSTTFAMKFSNRTSKN
jgi:hypothetical protein